MSHPYQRDNQSSSRVDNYDLQTQLDNNIQLQIRKYQKIEKIAKQLDEIQIIPSDIIKNTLFTAPQGLSAKLTLQNILTHVIENAKMLDQSDISVEDEDTVFRDNLKIIINTMVDEIWKQKEAKKVPKIVDQRYFDRSHKDTSVPRKQRFSIQSEKELDNLVIKQQQSVNSSPEFNQNRSKINMSLCNELNIEIEKLERQGPRGREVVEIFQKNFSKSPRSRRVPRRQSKSPNNIHLVNQNLRDKFYVSMPFSPNDVPLGSDPSYSLYNSQREKSPDSINSLYKVSYPDLYEQHVNQKQKCKFGTPSPQEKDDSFEEVDVDNQKNQIMMNYVKNQKCIDDSSSSDSEEDSYVNYLSQQNSFKIDDECINLRNINKSFQLDDSPDQDDFMDKIIQENNKNTYRWELGDKKDSVFPELVVEDAEEELEELTDQARVALGREDEQLIEKIKNARPLEFESVQEDYEAENQSSFEEELDFEVSKQPENFDILKSKISEKMKELELSVDHEIDESNPIICLTAEVDVDVTDNQAIFSTSKISRDSFEGRKQSFSKLFSSKLSKSSLREEEKTASIQFDSEEIPYGLCLEQITSPEHVRIVTESPPEKLLKPSSNTISPISPLKESVVEQKMIRKPMTFRAKKSVENELDTSVQSIKSARGEKITKLEQITTRQTRTSTLRASAKNLKKPETLKKPAGKKGIVSSLKSKFLNSKQ